MKRITGIFLMCILVIGAITGCGGANPEQAVEDTDLTVEEDSGEEGSSVTLDGIRKAAEDSGYNVYDENQLVFLSEVKGGFSVEITADDQTTVYSFVECETEDAAVRNAEDIDGAGYNIAIRDGRFVTCYAVDKEGGAIEGILSSLMAGNPVDKQPDSMVSEQSVGGSIVGSWVSGAVSGRYNSDSGKFEDVSGMGLIYTFHEDGTFAQLIVYGSYMATTGKYSVSDGQLTLVDRISVESEDSGQTWSEQEMLPDASSYFSIGTDDAGKYLLLGQEGSTPPLEASVNAMKFSLEK